MVHSLPVAPLIRLGFIPSAHHAYGGQILCWECLRTARRLIMNTETELIHFNKILRSGKSRQVAYSYLPHSEAELESQLQAINWL